MPNQVKWSAERVLGGDKKRMFWRMLQWVYSLLFTLLLPWVFIRLWLRSLKFPGYRRRWPEPRHEEEQQAEHHDHPVLPLLVLHSVSPRLVERGATVRWPT